MKSIGTFGVVVTASIALLQSAQGASRASGHSSSSAHSYSASSGHFSSPSRSFSHGTARFYGSSLRFSSQTAFRHRIASGPRLAVSRRATLHPQGFNNRGHVLGRSSRNWDRSRDHFWHGHRCRFFNNAWVIFDTGFYPWDYGYGYYPYGAYSYYDDRYDDDDSASSEYSQEPYPAQSEYDYGNPDSIVSGVQAALARNGYYRGAIDGSLGPGTRNALRRFQWNHGLDVTGRVDRPVMEALGLRSSSRLR